MTIAYTKSFVKQAKKLPLALQQKLHTTISNFADNPLDPALRNHALRGKYKAYRSIDITGDIRALYLTRADEAIFDMVGTHAQLYG